MTQSNRLLKERRSGVRGPEGKTDHPRGCGHSENNAEKRDGEEDGESALIYVISIPSFFLNLNMSTERNP